LLLLLLLLLPVCHHAAVKLTIVLGKLALKMAFVEGPKVGIAAADQHDTVILQKETETVAENLMSVIHNQNITYGYIRQVSSRLSELSCERCDPGEAQTSDNMHLSCSRQ
jgi:hypothetical protein